MFVDNFGFLVLCTKSQLAGFMETSQGPYPSNKAPRMRGGGGAIHHRPKKKKTTTPEKWACEAHVCGRCCLTLQHMFIS